jgi:3-hydroxyisobutyrate dehydrogenase
MSGRLVAAGYSVSAYDTNGEAVKRLVDQGAEQAQSPREAVSGAEIAVLSLPNPAIVEQVVAGDDGVLGALAPGGVIIDMSTIDPATTRALGQRTSEAGSSFLDAPVSGSVMKAETGELTIMVGGEADVLERCRPLLDNLGTKVVHMGPAGAGQVAKLCNNMMLAIIVAGLAETFVTGAKAGVDPRVLANVVSTSSGGNWALDSWLPLTTFADDYTPRFSLDLLYKDASLFGRTADGEEVPAPVAAATEEVLKTARTRGLGKLDMTSVIQMYEEMAGIRLLQDRSE